MAVGVSELRVKAFSLAAPSMVLVRLAEHLRLKEHHLDC
jgi:hypothetical protein